MKIVPIEAGPVATWSYLVIDAASSAAVIIDAPKGCASVFLPFIREENVRVEKILLTHSHWDHTADAAELQRELNAPVYVHEADNYRLATPMEHTLWPLPFTIEPVEAEGFLSHGQKIGVGSLEFELRFTPGHTEGGICFIEHGYKTAFVGDTLFAGSVGRTDLPGGDTKTLIDSIRRELLTLPDDYAVFPGHGEETTIGEERRGNPFLQGNLNF